MPDDENLRILLARYPRAQWWEHENIHGLSGHWLEIHNSFREAGKILAGGIADYREGRKSAPDFARWFTPRLNRLLGHLDTHHRIEDDIYFPKFVEAEKRLTRGFDILEGDHHQIHAALESNAEAANAFLRALQENEDKQRFAADNYAMENEKLVAMLTRHLDDEEDLIVPLILDRGDRTFGH
ncbi:MAG: hemerythrin domain-containing protein [Rhizobiaceae bacterium]|nr:hemerythrin domain-containing protein [Rhizobiaceae bacterium]